MAEVTGAQLTIEALKREGIDTVYVLPGDPVGGIVNNAAAMGMRVISVRHEQVGAMAAQAHSYFTRTCGVVIAASGPAHTNTITGMANAWANCWPLLVIAGSSENRRRNMGDFQEAPQVESSAPFCKWAYMVESTPRIPTCINTAVRHALSGRPGAVYLDLPAEVITQPVDAEDVYFPDPVGDPPRPMGDPRLIEEALQVLAHAERPLLIVGKGAAWARAEDELRTFVDRVQIPFLTSPMGMGMLPPDHPMGVAGARSQALKGADVVLLVGARFNWIFHFGLPPRFARGVKVIQIEIAPEEIGHNVPATVGIVGDAKMVLSQFNDALQGKHVRHGETDWIRSLREYAAKNAATIQPMLDSDAVPMGYYRIHREVRDFISEDTIVVADGASTMDISRQVVQTYRPRHRIDAGVYGCVGTGVPFSIAAKVCFPEKPVICLNGDWAFGFNGMDIETACRFRLPIVFMIYQNGNIDKWVRTWIEHAEKPNDFVPAIRYEKMMEAFGGHGEYVSRPEELRPALERSFNSGKASLINVVMDPGAARRPQEFGWLDRQGRMRY
jgi:2-hydroxyacyl-CoA lyase 1